jgi:two-component system cell cycle response regulator
MEAAVLPLVPGEAGVLISELERLHPLVRAHSRAVAVIGARVARVLGADDDAVRLAGSVHDVGKLTIPRSILDKPGPLTSSEWRLVRSHPAAGERLLHASFADRPEVLAAVRSHHERWDGGGYPDGLAGDDVPVAARIIAVADAFQAMLESRPYRPQRRAAEALDEIEAHAGAQFEPVCASALRLALEAGVTR